MVKTLHLCSESVPQPGLIDPDPKQHLLTVPVKNSRKARCHVIQRSPKAFLRILNATLVDKRPPETPTISNVRPPHISHEACQDLKWVTLSGIITPSILVVPSVRAPLDVL